MRKLLFVIGTLSDAGGEQRSLSILCNELVKYQSFNITIACLGGREIAYDLDSRIRVIHMEKSINTKRKRSRIRRLINLFDMVCGSEYHMLIGYGLNARIPIGLIRGFCSIPIIFCERANPEYRNPFIKKRIRNSIGMFMVRNINVVFQTKSAMPYYKKLKKTTVIPNLIDTEGLPDINSWSNRNCTVINASRCVYTKNHKMLINAFVSAHETCREYNLVIYGDGDTKVELLELIKQHKAESYIVVKPSTHEIFEHMNNSKMYVCSSHHEGYPNTLLEAMSMGMACISTECTGSVRDLIEDGVNGLVVPVDNEAAMAEALITLIKNDKMAEEIAERAAAVRLTNAKEEIIKKWISFINAVLEEKNGKS
jgi:glycosyltransferase involved in cell wall biosynthesis